MQKFGLESMLFIHKSQKSVQCFSPDKQIESMVLSGLKNVKRERSLLPPFFLFELNWNFFLRIRLQKLTLFFSTICQIFSVKIKYM